MQVKRAHDACGEQRPVSMSVSVCAREAGTERECRLHVSGDTSREDRHSTVNIVSSFLRANRLWLSQILLHKTQ